MKLNLNQCLLFFCSLLSRVAFTKFKSSLTWPWPLLLAACRNKNKSTKKQKQKDTKFVERIKEVAVEESRNNTSECPS